MKKTLLAIGIFFAIFFIVVFIALIVDISNDDNQSANISVKGDVTEDKESSISWEDKIKEIALLDLGPNDKFNEVSLFAKDYSPTKKEIANFEEYILAQYKEGKYLKDLSNHEYMLGNIFKSQVVDEYYEPGDNDSIKSFAFDFWQNSKYVYRGVDKIDSEATLANERQMDKAISKMNN
ncbi:hypothetical protein ACQKFO_22965 [Rossellomorea sp. NPDC071047]|uniref:hypothetical protein n=1 Tax=Rossellomorea sp. NPDC071047 TaxID=3390675 RepID=UPI003D0676C1